jgi:deoxyinosine 3'endonuclease (endonuclease V)
MRASDDSVVGDADRVAKIQVGNISEVDADKWFVSNDPRVMPRGVDIAYGEDRKLVFAVAVVVDWKTLRVKESVSVKSAIRFPYVPGLLSFREIPAIENALKRSISVPDLLVCEGLGIAHPRMA